MGVIKAAHKCTTACKKTCIHAAKPKSIISGFVGAVGSQALFHATHAPLHIAPGALVGTWGAMILDPTLVFAASFVIGGLLNTFITMVMRARQGKEMTWVAAGRNFCGGGVASLAITAGLIGLGNFVELPWTHQEHHIF